MLNYAISTDKLKIPCQGQITIGKNHTHVATNYLFEKNIPGFHF